MIERQADRSRDRVGQAVGAWVAASTVHPLWSLVLMGLLILSSLVAASHLTVDTDTSRMLSPDLPFQQRINTLNADFPVLKDTIVVAVRSDSADVADSVVVALAALSVSGLG